MAAEHVSRACTFLSGFVLLLAGCGPLGPLFADGLAIQMQTATDERLQVHLGDNGIPASGVDSLAEERPASTDWEGPARPEPVPVSIAAPAPAPVLSEEDDASGSTTADGTWVPSFRAPQLTPVQFLFISSPSTQKIVYTQLKNFKSKTGRTFTLIDSGLGEPCGLALDRVRGDLYVADRAAKSIFRYSIFVTQKTGKDGTSEYTLSTDGSRVSIVVDRVVEWVTVNHNGDVFYTDLTSNSINKISANLVERLGSGEVLAADVPFLSEKVLEAAADAAEEDSAPISSFSAKTSGSTTSTAASRAAALKRSAAQGRASGKGASYMAGTKNIMTIYEGSMNPHVSQPAGIATDGVRLFWANSGNGSSSVSVAQGEASPKAPLTIKSGIDPAPFPTTVLANNSVHTYGVAKSNSMVFYSSEDAKGAAVYGVDVMNSAGGAFTPYTFTTKVGNPRGLAWDGDSTLYVADEGESSVWSFPVGRLADEVPISVTVPFTGAYGIALLSEDDPMFAVRNGARTKLSVLGAFLLPLLVVVCQDRL